MNFSYDLLTEKRRTSEALSWAERRINCIIEEDGITAFRKTPGDIKYLIEEYLPIAIYANEIYSNKDY